MSTRATIYFLILLGSSGCQESNRLFPRIIDTIKVGVKMMERFINSEQNHLLSKIFNTFGKTPSEGVKEEFFSFMIKFFGIDSSKIKDYALDGIIALTYLISIVFTNKENSGKENFSGEFSPFQHLIRQPQVVKLYSQMQDPNLVDLIIDDGRKKLKNHSPEEFDCILLLFCKTFPFVNGMQKSLRFFVRRTYRTENPLKNLTNHYKEEKEEEEVEEDILWEKANWEDRMFFFLPSLSEVVKYGDECDKRFPSCQY